MMSSLPFQDVLDALSSLTEEELVIVRCEIDRRLNEITYEDGKIVYESIIKRLKGANYPPLSVYMRGKNSGKFVSFSEECIKLSKELRAPNILIFMDILIKGILDYLTDRHIPVTFNSVINQKENLLQIIDEVFPGYRKNGLLFLIWGSAMGKKLKK